MKNRFCVFSSHLFISLTILMSLEKSSKIFRTNFYRFKIFSIIDQKKKQIKNLCSLFLARRSCILWTPKYFLMHAFTNCFHFTHIKYHSVILKIKLNLIHTQRIVQYLKENVSIFFLKIRSLKSNLFKPNYMEEWSMGIS